MKKLIVIAAISALMISCNGNSSTKTESTSDSSRMENAVSADTSMNSMKDTTMNSMSSSSAMAPGSMKEGSMTMKDGKMMIMKDGKMVMMDQQMTCTDGCKVRPNGEVVMKDGKKMMITEGMAIDKDGN